MTRPIALPPGPVMVDVAGTRLTDAERARLQDPLVGAVILFARNFTDRAQLTALTAEIHALREPPLLIAVDHEGGRVQRFRDDGFTALPAMARLGERHAEDAQAAVGDAVAVGQVLAAELRACGVDFSFTPVLDLDYGHSAVIGNRAFSGDPAVVSTLSRALLQGLALAGLSGCGKHFPGHGYAEADSHHAVPVDERDLDTILAADVAPYGWLGDDVLGSVMPAHVIYPAVDALPAGFSPVWVRDILRGRLGYDGVVFSDDLTMEGATVVGDIVARGQAALDAGCDMVLVCNQPEQADVLLAGLNRGVEAEAVNRLLRLQPRGPALDWDSLQADAHYQRARARVQQLGQSA